MQTGIVRALEKSNFCKSVMYVSQTGAFFPRNHVQICTLYNLGILVFMKFLRSCDARFSIWTLFEMRTRSAVLSGMEFSVLPAAHRPKTIVLLPQ